MHQSEGNTQKPVILLVIDTLMDEPLQLAIQEDQVPALKFLKENGQYYPNLVSPFPTMSVNVDTTLLTGKYCDKHRLPGLVWYHANENRIINYGSSGREIRKLGMRQFFKDVLYHMNQDHISPDVKTIHEELADEGLPTASINALIYRGNHKKRFRYGKVLSYMTGREDEPINAPQWFIYGGLAKLARKHSGLINKFGFNDTYSAQEFVHLKQAVTSLPAVTVVYLPDFDQRVHKHGRRDAIGLQTVDKKVQHMLSSFDSWEQAIKENVWITMGDNGQAWVMDTKKDGLIDLRKMFYKYRIPRLGKQITNEDQLVLGVNERMSFIYTLHPDIIPKRKIVERLKQDKRIDIITWEENGVIHVQSGLKDGELLFREGGPLFDEYNQNWTLEGDISLLDIRTFGNNLLYGQYPDPLARLLSSLRSHDGDYVVANASPGYEFIGEGSPTHLGGGSHGGLHGQDSFVSLIITGTESRPQHLRIVDLKDWILSLTTASKKQPYH
ncbi:alkaline phosphatase family protein [Salirhabdus salicampi]|uniref:alkaline phosphatase family protein n=1 Tax=Salirhabdus salicampi TaxID=476102 RepID=UPI0020C3F91E|nr:alkaline phosphatase family protein [Salirhabdus salicampi]MCP8616048.1 alkaline phosphatase family protein [Salirhabdus salicampi]